MKPNNPLLKDKFMGGVRQKWCLVFLLSMFVVLACTVFFGIDPSPFMNFLLGLGTTFILGASATSFAKTNSASNIKQAEIQERTKTIEAESAPSDDVLAKQRATLQDDPVEP